MDPRERFTQFLSGVPYSDGVPAAFFQHFSPSARHGQAAMDAQLRFYRDTGMDIVKLMFDDIYPKISTVKKAANWRHITQFQADDPVFSQQIDLARRMVEAVGREAPVFQTIFTPFVSAGCAVSPISEWDKMVTPHFAQDPQAMQAGLEQICDRLTGFARQIAETGIDGFYVSVQGGERGRYSKEFFNTWLKPIDIAFLNALKATGKLVFVHICGVDMRLEDYKDYPADIINLAMKGNGLTLESAREFFGRPVMGGLDNTGTICTGTEQEIRAEVEQVLREAPADVMLGADCTIPAQIPVQNLRWAVEAAHDFHPRRMARSRR